MAFCVNCGKALNDDDKFCSGCGKENAEYNPNGGRKNSEYDITITPKIRLYGPQNAKTEIYVFIPQLGNNMRILVPNFVELGQTIRVRGEGLVKPSGEKGDLLVTPSEIEYYDTELTISACLTGVSDSVTKMPLYLPHAGKTVQISVPNNITVGKTLRLKGLGLDSPGGEKGDLYLHFDHIEHTKEESPVQRKEESERKNVFEGELHKCPSCGEILNSYVAVCPSCGYEVRGAKAVSSVKELAQKLEAIESSRERKRSRSLKDRMYGEEITKTDEQKISLIRSFAIPNTKEDLYEFLILAGSNIDIDLYDGTVLKTDARLAVSDAWKAKFEQAYQKAKLVFDGDPRFAEIQSIYDSTHKSIKKARGKNWKMVGMIYGGIAALFAIIFLLIAILSPGAEKKEVARLEAIVTEIENALENGEYKLALMNADSLDYSGTFANDELERKWEIQREYWIDKVIKEAADNGVVLESPIDDFENTSTPRESNSNSESVTEETDLQDSQTELIIETTATPTAEPTEAVDAVDYSTLTIEKGAQYTYGHDEWDLYVATAISNSIIKIEKWGKGFSSEKTFDNEYEVGAFRITDSENGFCWIDDEHTSFKFVLQDKSNGDFKKAKEIIFTIMQTNSDTNKGSNCIDGTVYSYQNDDWHQYKAVLLSEAIIKIECWYRPMALGSFHYGYDVCIVNLSDKDTDFEWTDEECTSFTITMTDDENSELKNPTFVAFEKEK